MRIGYPCINRTLSCQGNKTFRLKSYSKQRFIKTVENNLDCLKQILHFNREQNILFFRISSDTIPFASHPVLTIDWVNYFKDSLKKIGLFIKENNMRISMHPDQFIVLNSKKKDVVKRSVEELKYHAIFLDALELDSTAKIQLHVGGVYNDKQNSLNRFINHYEQLPEQIKKRLVIENDEKSYSAKDCFQISKNCAIPIVFDVLHHQINNHNESVYTILNQIASTWKKEDGLPMVDYSSQEKNEKIGKHAMHIDKNDFIRFLQKSNSIDFDVMLEIKDKENSAVEAIHVAKNDSRFIKLP
jgi:UV DNA damage endonuclease